MLGLEFPLRREGFDKMAAEMERSGEERKLPALPYARRGLSLRQLKEIRAGVNSTEWLPKLCEEYNKKHETEIKEKKSLRNIRTYTL